MTVNEFVKKYKSGVDFDGMYGKQCVDYVNAYASEVLASKTLLSDLGLLISASRIMRSIRT